MTGSVFSPIYFYSPPAYLPFFPMNDLLVKPKSLSTYFPPTPRTPNNSWQLFLLYLRFLIVLPFPLHFFFQHSSIHKYILFDLRLLAKNLTRFESRKGGKLNLHSLNSTYFSVPVSDSVKKDDPTNHFDA